FVDQVSNGCGEHAVKARDFPMLLQHDREGQPVLPHFGAIRFRLAAADHEDGKARQSLRAVGSSAFKRSGPRKRGTPNVWRRARSDTSYLALLGENDSMKLLQLGRELIARAAFGIRKNQQHAASAKFVERKFAAIDARK